MIKIQHIHAFEILDSRGNPTIKTVIYLENGIEGAASVPSGASTGTHEAFELRDNERAYHGKGVQKAILNVNQIIAPRLIGQSINSLKEIDQIMIELDGTPNKAHLGANAILSVSLACMRAYAQAQHVPLWDAINTYYFGDKKPEFPRFMINLINGGLHANWNFDFQEFLISPKINKPNQALEIGSEIFHTLEHILIDEHYSTLKGDEGGFSPLLDSNEQAFSLLQQSIDKAGHHDQVDIGIDLAATEFYKDDLYELKLEHKKLQKRELIQYCCDLKKRYNVFSFEDPLSEDDFIGFSELRHTIGFDTLIIGDDLYTTNFERLKNGIELDATNAILIKPNQIGTLSETVNTIRLAQKANMKIVISHRSGETEDSFIADLAFACSADFIKSGSMSRSERLVKYNRLREIQELEL